jgi:protein gp37
VSDNTKIEWADATVNAINGCSVTSPGCTNCYAMKLAGTRMKSHPTREGLTIETKAGPVWTGEVRLHEPALLQPFSWSKPRRIFWNAHGDTFHDAVPDEWIDRVFAVAALTPQHTHMILTKRSKRMREYWACNSVWDRIAGRMNKLKPLRYLGGRYEKLDDAPLRNVWLGVSVEDQTRADERREDFRNTPAAVKFVSYEPALGYVNWAGWEFIDQIIAGGGEWPACPSPTSAMVSGHPQLVCGREHPLLLQAVGRVARSRTRRPDPEAKTPEPHLPPR